MTPRALMAASAPPAPGPRPCDQGRAFRTVLGRFATGVTVMTCAAPMGPVGMTVNAFTSLSLDPPLVMWAPSKSSLRAPSFAAAPRFGVHILAEEQRPVAEAFMRNAQAFDALDYAADPDGLPLIEGCLARLVCRRVAEHDGGDHTILIGRVDAMTAREGAPLLYYAGRYETLAA